MCDQSWWDHGQGACVSLCLVHQDAPRPSPAQVPSSPHSEGAELRYLDTQVQRCEDILQQLRAVVPQMDMEGDRNIWIVKPGAKSRGRGGGLPLLPRTSTLHPPQPEARDVNSTASVGAKLPSSNPSSATDTHCDLEEVISPL